MRHDWSLHFQERTTIAAEASARRQALMLKEIRKVREDLAALVDWVKRLTLIAALWGSGLWLHLSSDQAVELALKFLKAR